MLETGWREIERERGSERRRREEREEIVQYVVWARIELFLHKVLAVFPKSCAKDDKKTKQLHGMIFLSNLKDSGSNTPGKTRGNSL